MKGGLRSQMDNQSNFDAHATEQRYQLLVNAVSDYAIYMLDPTGHILTWNAGARRFKGYTADEVIGEHFSRFFTPEDRAAGVPETMPRTAFEEGRFEGFSHVDDWVPQRLVTATGPNPLPR